MPLTMLRTVKLAHGKNVVLREVWRKLLLRLLVLWAPIGGLHQVDEIFLFHSIVLLELLSYFFWPGWGQSLLAVHHVLVTFPQVSEGVYIAVLSSFPFTLYMPVQLKQSTYSL